MDGLWLFDWAPYMPRGGCVAWRLEVLIPYALGQLLIFLAYAVLPALLIWALGRWRLSRWDLPLGWYAAFVLCCGTGHLLETVVIWVPWYPVLAVWHSITGIVSLVSVLKTLAWVRRRAVSEDPEVIAQERDTLEGQLEELRELVATGQAFERISARIDAMQGTIKGTP